MGSAAGLFEMILSVGLRERERRTMEGFRNRTRNQKEAKNDALSRVVF
jgi:hypothetical protein